MLGGGILSGLTYPSCMGIWSTEYFTTYLGGELRGPCRAQDLTQLNPVRQASGITTYDYGSCVQTLKLLLELK